MQQLRKYLVYLDDGDYIYKVAVPATSEEFARDFCNGNGEVIAVKDVTEECLIDNDKVREVLTKSHKFDENRVDYICRTLRECGITN